MKKLTRSTEFYARTLFSVSLLAQWIRSLTHHPHSLLTEAVENERLSRVKIQKPPRKTRLISHWGTRGHSDQIKQNIFQQIQQEGPSIALMNRFNSMKVPNPFAKTWNTRSLAKYLKQNFPYKDFFPRSLKDIYDKININNHVHSTENIELVIRALWNRPGALEALLAKYYELDTDPDSVSQHLNAHGLRDNSGDLWTAGSVESAMIEAKPPEK